MHKLFDFLQIKKKAKLVAIIMLIVALCFEIVEFTSETISNGFSFEYFFAFIFDIAVTALIVFSLIKINIKLLEISIVVLKTFEGTYYPMRSAERLDVILSAGTVDTFNLVTHIFFAIASICMLIALVFYCLYKLTGRLVLWDIMKICMLTSSLAMIISAVLYTVEISRGEIHWEEILEPLTLACMFLGVYATCEFIEEEVENKKTNVLE